MSDLISRQDALKVVAEWLDSVFGIKESDGTATIYKQLRELPSAEPRTGKWIDTTSGEHYKCSECGTRASYYFNEENSCEWEMDMPEWLSDFCPNCGADMRDEIDQ